MKSTLLTVASALPLALVLFSADARAEHPGIDVYVSPFIGGESLHVTSVAVPADLQSVHTTSTSGLAFAGGVRAGVVLGGFRLGVFYQRTTLGGATEVAVDQFHGEVGAHGRVGLLGLDLSVSAGWASLGVGNLPSQDGVGGRVAGSVEFWLGSHVSIGPMVSLDGAYAHPDLGADVAWGVTGALSVGLHL